MTATRHPLKTESRWTPQEDNVLRACYPSYDTLLARLPHRSLSALKKRVRAVGIANRRHIWTNKEVGRLLEAFKNGLTDVDLQALFPTLTLGQIKSKAGHMQAPQRPPRLVFFDIPALDAIRNRAAEAGMSLVELDARARTGRFFQRSSRRVRLKHLAKAAAVLGGEVMIEWDDLN